MKEYGKELKKRDVQEVALSAKKHKAVLGLAGPNSEVYLKVLRSIGFREIVMFEKDERVYLKQKRKNLQCDLIYGDILNHLNEKGFYDFDFCCNITKIEMWLPEILRKDYALTVSLRPIGLPKTISLLREYGEAKYIKYFDSSAMTTFFNN